MKWMRLTRHSGDEIFVNLAQVVYVEPWEQSGVRGAKVHTVFKDKDGMPMQIEVREAPETKGFRAVPNPQARPLRRSLHGGGGQTRQASGARWFERNALRTRSRFWKCPQLTMRAAARPARARIRSAAS